MAGTQFVSGGGGVGQAEIDSVLARLNALELPLDKEALADTANTDDFNGDMLDSVWVSPATASRTVDVSVADSYVTIQPSATGTASTSSRGGYGIRRPVSGSFDVSAKISDGGSAGGTDDSRIGIFAGTIGGSGQIVGYQNSASRLVNNNQFAGFSLTVDWGAVQGEWLAIGGAPPLIYWYRMVYDAGASTLSVEWSANGLEWRTLVERTSIPAFDWVGLAMYGNVANLRADHRLKCDWFRLVT